MKITIAVLFGAVAVCMPAQVLSQALITKYPDVAVVQPAGVPGSEEPSLAELGRSLAGKNGGQCVAFIQRLFESYYSDPGFRGWASEIKPNSQTPKVGAAVLERGKIGHAAIVAEVGPEYIVVLESNYKLDGVISYGRKVKIGSDKIRGYFHFAEKVIH